MDSTSSPAARRSSALGTVGDFRVRKFDYKFSGDLYLKFPQLRTFLSQCGLRACGLISKMARPPSTVCGSDALTHWLWLLESSPTCSCSCATHCLRSDRCLLRRVAASISLWPIVQFPPIHTFLHACCCCHTFLHIPSNSVLIHRGCVLLACC